MAGRWIKSSQKCPAVAQQLPRWVGDMETLETLETREIGRELTLIMEEVENLERKFPWNGREGKGMCGQG